MAVCVLAGCSDAPDSPRIVEPPVDLPPDPISLHLTGNGPLADTLGWSSSSSSDFARYRLFRIESGDTSRTLERVDAQLFVEIENQATVSAIDSTVSPGRAYAYWLEVVDQAGQLGASDPITLITPRLERFGLGFAPRLAELAPGDTLELELWIEGAPPLFGAALDLSWPNAIELLDFEKGAFFGEDALAICQAQAGGAGLSVTRVRGAEPIAGSGILARLRVRVATAGRSVVGFGLVREFRDEHGFPVTSSPSVWEAVLDAESAFHARAQSRFAGSTPVSGGQPAASPRSGMGESANAPRR